jgi:hypothetical protein
VTSAARRPMFGALVAFAVASSMEFACRLTHALDAIAPAFLLASIVPGYVLRAEALLREAGFRAANEPYAEESDDSRARAHSHGLHLR